MAPHPALAHMRSAPSVLLAAHKPNNYLSETSAVLGDAALLRRVRGTWRALARFTSNQHQLSVPGTPTFFFEGKRQESRHCEH